MSKSRRSRRVFVRHFSGVAAAVESFEERRLFAAPTLAALPASYTVQAGAPLQVPLDGFDADGDALTFTVQSTSGVVGAAISPTANRSLKISVSHASPGASDPAFTGDVVIKLFEDRAPVTTARIIQLAQSGFYNGLGFHRVIDGFMIQGGDPLGNGTGGSGVDFDDEFDAGLQFTGRGLLAMAKSYDDTNDSQFFITEGTPRNLDFNHTIFGQVVEGEAVREKISNVPTDANDRPLGAVTMTAVGVIADRQNGVLSLSAANGAAAGTTSQVTVTATDPAGNKVSRTFTVTVAADAANASPFLTTVPSQFVTRAGVPVNFQLGATDVEGDARVFLNYVGIYVNFVDPQTRYPSGEVGRVVLPDPNQSIRVDLDGGTGAGTVTPPADLAGVFPIYVGVAQDLRAFDSQVVPLFVSPAAPASIDLLDGSDTGVNTGDDVTRLNNSDAGSKLQFQVGGVLPGAVVKLFDGATLLGQVTVPAGATSVTITTTGGAALANGSHNLTATQTLANYAWSVGNRSGVTDLASVASAGLAVTVDATAPTAGVAPFNVAVAPHGLTLTFSEDVADTLAAGDLRVTNLTTGATVAVATMTPLPAVGQYRFTFDAPGGVLPDGSYRATVAAGDVADRAGNSLSAGAGAEFYVLAGDANRDRTVNFNDLLVVAKNYNKVGVAYGDGDLNYDGLVNFDDLLVLAKAYNKTLAPPVAPAPAIPEVSAATAAAASVTPTIATTVKTKSVTPLLLDPPHARPAPVKPKPAGKPVRRN